MSTPGHRTGGKTVTGLYLQFCEYSAIFNNNCSHEYYCQIHDAYARQLKYLIFEREHKH